eukprot:4626991-Prymnesium_polylepis.1
MTGGPAGLGPAGGRARARRGAPGVGRAEPDTPRDAHPNSEFRCPMRAQHGMSEIRGADFL